MEMQRYNVYEDMNRELIEEKDDTGAWVKVEDVESIQAENKILKESLKLKTNLPDLDLLCAEVWKSWRNTSIINVPSAPVVKLVCDTIKRLAD